MSKRRVFLKYKYIVLLFVSLFVFSAYVFSQSSCKVEVTVLELIELMENEDKLIILDVRNPEELVGELGHIKGVINIPVHKLEVRLSELNNYKSKIIPIICRSGNRSGYATTLLNRNGFTAVNVKGGMRAYNKAVKN